MSTLSRSEKMAYVNAIAEGKIKRPKRLYPNVIITQPGGLKTLQGDTIDQEFMDGLPYPVTILLPSNGRELHQNE